MWRLYRPLNSLSTFLVGLLVGGVWWVAGNCAYDQLFTPAGCSLALNPQDLLRIDAISLLRPSLVGVILSLLLLGALRLAAGRSFRHREARNEFALFKSATRLRPEDLGFQVLSAGQHPEPGRRPFYPGYVSRHTKDVHTQRVFNEESLVVELEQGRGFVLLSEPLGGKTRTLYEIAKRMVGYDVISPAKGYTATDEETFAAAVKGRKVILLLDDLNAYIAVQTPLQDFAERLDEHAGSWVVISACSDGPEMAVVKAAEGTNLGRFYRDRIHKEQELQPLTVAEKERLARRIGEGWSRDHSEWFPTPGAITTAVPLMAMRQRFQHALTTEQQDVLRALKLLTTAGIQPYTHFRLRAVMADDGLFGRPTLHLRDCLTSLADQSFISRPATHDPVQPEPAYLRGAVTYIEGQSPRRDFPKLANVLEETADYRGLNLLGLTCGWVMDDGEQALAYFERARSLNSDFVDAWGNAGSMLGKMDRHEEALKFFDRVLKLNPDNLIALYNKANALNFLGRHKQALEILEELSIRWPNNPNVWHVQALALHLLDQNEAALKAYDRALSISSDDPQVWHDKGMVLTELRRVEDALDALDRSLSLQPNLLSAWRMKAMMLIALGRQDDALSTIDETLDRWPDDPDSYIAKGVILKDLERHEEAHEWLCRAWHERHRLEGNGADAAQLLADLGLDPHDCD